MYVLIQREYSQNTTCVEKMVYCAIETTCFGLYWSSPGFYNIKEKNLCTKKRVVKGLMYRSLNQHPLTVFTAFIDSSLIL